MNMLSYYTRQQVELAQIRALAETRGYRCTSYTLRLPNGRESLRLNVHFHYEGAERPVEEFYWQWAGGTQFGFRLLQQHLHRMEDWQQERLLKYRPESVFQIGYHLFSLPYLAQFLILLLKQHKGWVEDAFSQTMYTVQDIETLPVATAAYLRTRLDETETPGSDEETSG